MNIANMKVAIRPMSTAQALDLGTMMGRHWFLPLWKIWLGMAFPIFIIFGIGFTLITFMFSESTDDLYIMKLIGTFIFWWLKPIYEKPMLAWLGQALFTHEPDTKSTIKQGWRTAKYFALPFLITKRLSLKRQLIIPIAMLEKPDRSQFNQRLSLLSRGQGGGLNWHTIILVHIESMIAIAMVLFLSQLVPTDFMKAETLFQYMEYSPLWFELLWTTLYFFAASIVAPFFVAGGFAVYLTKRCLLEGWDVELVFKQLRYRYEQAQSSPLNVLKQTNIHAPSQSQMSPVDNKTNSKSATTKPSISTAKSRQVHANESNSFLNSQVENSQVDR